MNRLYPRTSAGRAIRLGSALLVAAQNLRRPRALVALTLASACAAAGACGGLAESDPGGMTGVGLGGAALVGPEEGSSAEVGPFGVTLFGPDEAPYGLSYQDWLAAYWQWHLSLPREGHPREGGGCDQGNGGQVWFLTTGRDGRREERFCSIPPGRPVFFVLNATLDFPKPDCNLCVPSESRQGWFAELDDNLELIEGRLENNTVSLTIDGREQPVGRDYFVVTEAPFHLSVPPIETYFSCVTPFDQDICGWETGEDRPMISSGFAVMLAPLPRGEHVLSFGAQGSESSWNTHVTYHITVE